MKNQYGIPEEDLDKIKVRDNACVYCHKTMIEPSEGGSRKNWATIEHLNHLPPWNNPNTVAFCCGSCNSSRSNKKIVDWFKTPYCIERNISFDTVAEPVKEYIKKYENLLKQ
ncbi:MAG TPA: HNH endonuclease [Candidatus Yonathbacteria bacterium]|nr:HNH endonuclease [Candidatus Yonathbacteria bacterium]